MSGRRNSPVFASASRSLSATQARRSTVQARGRPMRDRVCYLMDGKIAVHPVAGQMVCADCAARLVALAADAETTPRARRPARARQARRT